MKCDGTRAETRFCLSANGRVSLNRPVGTSVRSTAGSRGACISGSNAGYTVFRCSVKGTGYPLHSQVSPSLPLLRVTVYHHVSTGLYKMTGYEYVVMKLWKGKVSGRYQWDGGLAQLNGSRSAFWRFLVQISAVSSGYTMAAIIFLTSYRKELQLHFH